MAPTRILMIDDSDDHFDQIRAAFTGAAELTHARHAAEAIERLREGEFHAILLDQQWDNRDITPERLVDAEGRLPAVGPVSRDEQGEGILRFLRGNNVTQPVIFCSVVEDQATVRRLCQLDVLDFLPKRDAIDHPDWVLRLLQEEGPDRAALARLANREGVTVDRVAENWLLCQRGTWGRQWLPLAGAVLCEAGRRPRRHLGMRRIEELQGSQKLPDLLREHHDPVTATELRRLLKREVALRRMGDGLWLGAGDGVQMAVIEPGAVAEGARLPVGWEQTTAAWHQICPVVRPTSLRWIDLGPGDPFWGGPSLLVAESAGAPWDLDEAPDVAGLVPWPFRAGRVGSPGAGFWDRRKEELQQVSGLSGSHRPAMLPGLLTVGLDRSTSGKMELLPLAADLLTGSRKAEQADNVAKRLLLALHAGFWQADRVPADRLAEEMSRLPRVEVRRAGWVDAFEEEVLETVLAILKELNVTPAVVWVGCDFLRARRDRSQPDNPLTFHAQEFDLVILTRHGIVVLECKGSTKGSDFRQGHTQIKKARGRIWATADQKDSGVWLLPLLRERLGGLAAVDAIPDDVLEAVPYDFVSHLKSFTCGPARAEVDRYFRPLAHVRSRPADEPDLNKFDDSVRCSREVSDVVGFVVAPDGFTGMRQPFLLRQGHELPRMLRGWLARTPIFDDDQFRRVRDVLVHLSATAEVQGHLDIEGFEADENRGRLGEWRHQFGRTRMTGQEQTWLVLTLDGQQMHEGERSDLDQKAAGERERQVCGRWFATALRNLVGDLRWLDSRGLPAHDLWDLRRLGIALPGQVYGPESLASLPALVRIDGAIALTELLMAEPVREVLGLSCMEPLPVAQQLPETTDLRWAWLPGFPGSESASPATTQHGLRRTLQPLRDLLGEQAGNVALGNESVEERDLLRLLRRLRALRELAV